MKHADILTSPELGRITRLSRATIALAIDSGRLPAFRTTPNRGQIRIHRHHAEAWLRELYGGRHVKLDPERGMIFAEELEPVAGA
jgi:hypothetical protein